MPDYVFFFGRNPVLSLAELVTVLKNQFPETEIKPLWKEAALVQGFGGAPAGLIRCLGGTTKIAMVLFETRALKEKEFREKLESEKFFVKLPAKFFFAVSLAGTAETSELETVLEALKKGFKANRQKALLRHTTSHKEQNKRITNPGEIISWNLLENKTDLALAKTKEGFLFCQTVVVFDPAKWEWRDENRPHKDNKEIVSIRLAKMLINLAGLNERQTVLDPFCGYGTILQEALLIGLNGIGIEKDKSKAQAARQNLAWVVKNFKVAGKATVHSADATRLGTVLKKGDFQAAVTEPYLGPYLTKKPSPARAQAILNELWPLYQTLFFELAQLSVKGTRVVFIFPVFELPNRQMLRLPETVFSNWFESKNPLQALGPAFGNSFPFLYKNPGNKLLREIRVLQRK